MRLKVVTIDFHIPRSVRKWGVRLGIPVGVLLSGGAIAWAAGLHAWNQGDTLNASDLNGNFSYLESQILAPVDTNLSSVGGATVNPSTTPMIWQAGSTIVTTAAGVATVTFPKPFPNGLLTVQVTNGDSSSCGGQAIWEGSGASVTGFPIYNGGNGTCRVNWVAIGW
jgi:hypothetical protein